MKVDTLMKESNCEAWMKSKEIDKLDVVVGKMQQQNRPIIVELTALWINRRQQAL